MTTVPDLHCECGHLQREHEQGTGKCSAFDEKAGLATVPEGKPYPPLPPCQCERFQRMQWTVAENSGNSAVIEAQRGMLRRVVHRPDRMPRPQFSQSLQPGTLVDEVTIYASLKPWM